MKLFIMLITCFVSAFLSSTVSAEDIVKDNFVNETKLSIVGSSVTVSITTEDGQTIKYASTKRVKVFFQMQDEVVPSTNVALDSTLKNDGIRVVAPEKGRFSKWISEWPEAAITVAYSLKEGAEKAIERKAKKPARVSHQIPEVAKSTETKVEESSATFQDTSCTNTGFKEGDVVKYDDGRLFVFESPCAGKFIEELIEVSTPPAPVVTTKPYVERVVVHDKVVSKEGNAFPAKGARYVPTARTVYIFDQCQRYMTRVVEIGSGKKFEDIQPDWIKPIGYNPRIVIRTDVYTKGPDPKFVMKGKPEVFDDVGTSMLYLKCGEPLQWVRTKDLKEFPPAIRRKSTK